MIFVISGCIVYKPMWDPFWDKNDVLVCTGMWACETTLWSRTAVLSGPLVGGAAGADILTVGASDFQDITRTCTGSTHAFLDYAEAFIQKFNEASDDSLCTDFCSTMWS